MLLCQIRLCIVFVTKIPFLHVQFVLNGALKTLLT